MTDLEKIKSLVKMQECYGRIQEINSLYKEQDTKYTKVSADNFSLISIKEDVEINVHEMDKKINEELGKRDEIQTRINNLDEGKDKIKIARQLKSWEKEMERMQQELSLIQAQINYDTSKQLEMKNELERLNSKIEDNNGKLAELKEEIDSIKVEHEDEISKLDSEFAELREKHDIQFMDYFETMLIKTRGQAIVLVEEDACSGCNIVLPTELQGDLGADLEPDFIETHQCPHCFRYLYYEEWLDLVEHEIGI